MRPWKGARDRMQPATGCSGSPASWAPTGAGPGGLGSDRGGQLEDGQVVACAGFQFGCRFRMGLKRLHLACDRARARTSWAGTASTRPERRSSNRWSASEAQALRISGSVSGSRLSTRRSARSARRRSAGRARPRRSVRWKCPWLQLTPGPRSQQCGGCGDSPWPAVGKPCAK